MHRGDGHVTLLTASGVIYDMLFTNAVCCVGKDLAKSFRMQQTVFVHNVPTYTRG